MNRIITARTATPLTFIFALACMVFFSSAAMAQGSHHAKHNHRGKVVTTKTVSKRGKVVKTKTVSQRGKVVTTKTVTSRGKAVKRNAPKKRVTRTVVKRHGQFRHQTARTPVRSTHRRPVRRSVTLNWPNLIIHAR